LILSGLAIAGLVATVVLAVKATPKALNKLELEKEYVGDEEDIMPENVKLTPKQTVKVVWKDYIPAAITGAATVSCIVGSHRISHKRISALAGLYSVTTKAFNDYKDKVVEKLGDNVHRAITDEVRTDKVEKTDITDKNPIIITGDGDCLCYDVYSGRYFRSNIEKLRKTENKLNQRIIHDNYVCLNDMYYEWKLDSIKNGYDIGWNTNHLIEFAFSSAIKDDQPVLVVDYVVGPYYDYEKY
jgi:hypothetical protein